MKKIFILILILSSYSCNNTHKSYVLISDGKLKEVIYSGNNVIAEQEFIIAGHDTVPNGSYKEYYDGGELKAESYYKMGMKDSVSITYFENLSIKGFFNRFEGRPIGKQVEYYANGNVATITLAGGYDSVLFYIHFFENGGVDSIKGIPLYVNANSKTITKQEKFVISHNVIKEKDIRSILNIKFISPDGRVVYDSTPTNFYTFQNNQIFDFTGIFDAIGSYVYSANIKLLKGKDTIVDKTLIDTFKVVD
jgi:hypothetical protein